MKVETLTIAAGRLSFRAGEILDLSDKDAKELIEAGAARLLVKPAKVTKKATSPKAEK